MNAGAARAFGQWAGTPLTRMALIVGPFLLAALATISWFAAEAGRGPLLEELTAKAQTQGDTVRRKIERAFTYGIPEDRLLGLDVLYDRLVLNDPNLLFMTVTASDGRVLATAGQPERQDTAGTLETRLPLSTGGVLRVGHDRAAAMKPLADLRLDIATVLLVVAALAFEVMLLVFTLSVVMPARTAERVLADVAARRYGLVHGQVLRDELGRFLGRLNAAIVGAAQRIGSIPRPLRMPQVIGVRLLAFLFVFAEELARPVMPMFFAEITGGGLDRTGAGEAAGGTMGASIAMTAHMLVVAIAMPLGSALYAHVGRLPLYVSGALLATVGLAGTALLADGLGELVAWRAVSGLGYAATFVACQGHVLESTNDSNRVQGSAMMVAGIMLADICGPAIGGIVAGHFGAQMTFLLGAGVALVAALSAGVLLGRGGRASGTALETGIHPEETPPRLSFGVVSALLGNARLLALLLLAAVPAKLILTAFLYFLVPLTMREGGHETADIGRVIMLYGMAALFTGPFLARLTDRSGRPMGAVAIGGLMTAVGLTAVGWGGADGWSIALAVIALGLAHSLSIPAQVAALLSVTETAVSRYGKGPVVAVLRLFERLGAAAGPLTAAGLIAVLGSYGAIWALGLYAGISALLMLLVLWLAAGRWRRES